MSEKTDALAEKAPDDTSADAKAGEQLVPTTIGGRQPPPVAFDEIDAATEKRVVRKLDRRLLPLVSLLYLVAFRASRCCRTFTLLLTPQKSTEATLATPTQRAWMRTWGSATTITKYNRNLSKRRH